MCIYLHEHLNYYTILCLLCALRLKICWPLKSTLSCRLVLLNIHQQLHAFDIDDCNILSIVTLISKIYVK